MPKRPGQGLITYVVLLALILYILVSGAIAVATADDCGRLNADKRWKMFPPEWECVR